MELRHLQVFVAVARAGTVTGAANVLELAPASVSEQVRRLENGLGVTLFDRTPRGMRLTAPGKALLERAQGLLDHADEVRRAVTGRRRRVTVGALEMLAATRLPGVVRRLAERRPDLDVDVRTLNRGQLLAAVADGGVDAALLLDAGMRIGTLGFRPPDGLDFLDVGEVALRLVAAPGGDARTLLVSPPECSIRMAVERMFAADVPRRELTSISTAREWVRQGLGRSLLPDFAVDADLDSGALVTVAPAPEECRAAQGAGGGKSLDASEGTGRSPALALRMVWTRGREAALRDVLYAMSD
ncbi:LysR family transcriptional regulator [Nonomuraea terrae]|uniref:LysR family transcriptional regulator n=1 Tax=Nonomuraea terrae TaxID=2530383 RepID=A0A4R4XFY3_9ACTN|nr:LysR family transcriptional regulator [Nonomuraea terrae]TDD29614.1 LysR family transcriptional regulator [Nonomuraea terrae]